MRTFKSNDTPADAPAVRKMSSGSAGYPSRSKIIVSNSQMSKMVSLTFDKLCDMFTNKRDALAV